MTGPHADAPTLRLQHNGEAETLEQALEAFDAAIAKWLARAKASGQPCDWNER